MITASVFDTREALNKATLRLMRTVISAGRRGPTALIVPGGRTPRSLFESLVAQPVTPAPDFYLGYTDDRHVPETDPQSNYALTRDMIRTLGLPPSRVLRVRTELPLEESASRYHDAWQDFFDLGGTVPLALLGLGDDGHTCSLFTPEQVDACGPDTFAASVRRETGPDRITVTPALLGRVEHVIILAAGNEKAAVVDAMLHESSPVTAARAVARAPRVSLWYAPQDGV